MHDFVHQQYASWAKNLWQTIDVLLQHELQKKGMPQTCLLSKALLHNLDRDHVGVLHDWYEYEYEYIIDL